MEGEHAKEERNVNNSMGQRRGSQKRNRDRPRVSSLCHDSAQGGAVSIRVAAGTERDILEYPSKIAIQVQVAPDLVEVAAEALDLARLAIREELPTLEHAEVVRVPPGPFLVLDAGMHPVLNSLTAIVALNLRGVGIDDAVIAALSPSPIGFLASMPGAVVCRIFPPSSETRDQAPQPVPAEWVAEAAAWLTDGLEGSFRLWGESRGVEFPIAVADAQHLFHLQRHDLRCDALAVAGNGRSDAPRYRRRLPFTPAAPEHLPAFWHEQIGRRLRGSALRPYVPHVVMAGGGADATEDELLTVVEGLRTICQRLASGVGYAFIDICPTLAAFTNLTHPTEWAGIGGERTDALEPICDEVVFDAFPHQILGPGHLARLGGIPPGAVALDGGRFELAIDTPDAWVVDRSIPSNPDRPWYGLAARRKNKTVQVRARAALSQCLVRAGQAKGIVDVRWDRVQRQRLGFEDLYQRNS